MGKVKNVVMEIEELILTTNLTAEQISEKLNVEIKMVLEVEEELNESHE
jgi:predicted transposase YdaD